MKVGVLTGGGDCPGLNAVIRAVARRSFTRGHEVVGVREGWRGLVDGIFEPLGGARSRGCSRAAARSSARRARTPTSSTAGSTRCSSASWPRASTRSWRSAARTRSASRRASTPSTNFPVVGVPKTIDNDLSGTDYTFGFDTAVFICTEAIDRLHTTAESHNRVMVVEVMGRHTGWIAVVSGIAGGADVILIPEQPVSIEDACKEIQRRHERGKDFSIVVVSEGYELEGGRGRPARSTSSATCGSRSAASARGVAHEIEQRTGFETRVTVLGHVQRGGSPTPRDRVLATRYGLKAADLVHEGRFGRMAALRGDSIVDVSLEEATAELKTVPEDWYEVARAFFG